ncbi:MAG: NAD-dependent epimerase/dehydratase family protein [Solirubrobacterales bacterium]
MRSLVTGGAGFIGSHVVDALIARRDEVVVFDDFSTGKHENLAAAVDQGAQVRDLDVTDSDAVSEAIGSFSPQRVFHLAAQIDVRKSMADPGFDVRLNVLGTVNVLEAAARAGAERFVFTSSGGTVYGEGEGREDELPFSEDAPNRPDSIYGQSKLAAEGYVQLYARNRGLPAVTLRLANVYGPRQDPATEAGVVAIFSEKARGGRRPDVFGTGEQTRDYIHVADVVAAILAADASDEAGPFNVGTGVETTVLELVELIGLATGRDDFEPEFEPRREGEVERNVLDSELAARELGWRAERTISAGLEETLNAEG